MKLLIACNIDSYDNPYVSSLAEELSNQGVDVTCSIDEFWHHAIDYDLVHIQWPNLLVNESGADASFLQQRLDEIHEAGIKIIVTLHNLVPHYSMDTRLLTIYKLIYANADCIIHLGEASILLLKDQIPDLKAEHVVIPHHTFDTVYDMSISKMDARKRLGIPENAKCVMSFGRFRDDEERKMLINVCKSLPKDIYYLMPGFYKEKVIRKNVIKGIQAFVKRVMYSFIVRKLNIHINYSFVPDEMLPFYVKAADVQLIQRTKILNSGGVSLAMLAGIPIVGPDVGNVGSILKKTGNYVFDVNNLSSLPSLIQQALNDKSLGMHNKEYGERELMTSSIVKQLIRMYSRYWKKNSKEG